jgi:hypothetical protein
MKDVRESMQEIEIEAIVEDIEDIEIPEIDEEKIRMEIESAIAEIEAIDTQKIHEEIEIAMASVCDAMKNIELPDLEEIKTELELVIDEIEEIDHEKIIDSITKKDPVRAKKFMTKHVDFVKRVLVKYLKENPWF